MNKESDNFRAAASLYPPLRPFDQQLLDVGQGHHLFVEQSGNPDGLPVVVFHGGPGGGCNPGMRRFFDPSRYRIILFDQRGCGRSTPFSSVENNTTPDLLRDIERIRDVLGIESWVVFGGSWGATLALIYAQAHPERVKALVLRGVFLMTRAELDWFYGGGAGRFWPEHWDRFCEPIPEDERTDMIGAYHKRLFCGDRAIEMRYAQCWAAWENALASMTSSGWAGGAPSRYAHAFARIENHYFINGGFLEFDGQILAHMGRIENKPGVIVHGRYDMICPPKAAYELSKRWPNSQLEFVKDAGHALSEPGIAMALVRATDAIAKQMG